MGPNRTSKILDTNRVIKHEQLNLTTSGQICVLISTVSKFLVLSVLPCHKKESTVVLLDSDSSPPPKYWARSKCAKPQEVENCSGSTLKLDSFKTGDFGSVRQMVQLYARTKGATLREAPFFGSPGVQCQREILVSVRRIIRVGGHLKIRHFLPLRDTSGTRTPLCC